MPNNENDLSDNSGNPHIGSDFNDFLNEEGIKEDVTVAVRAKLLDHQQVFAQRMKDGPIMHINISGPVGIGKTILASRIERLLKEEFNVEYVIVSDAVRQEQNAMNMADWQTSMANRMAKTIYTIDEQTVVQVNPEVPT